MHRNGKDCAGVCFGPAKRDDCGVCNGDNSTCGVFLTIDNVDEDNQTFDVLYSSPEDIAGFLLVPETVTEHRPAHLLMTQTS